MAALESVDGTTVLGEDDLGDVMSAVTKLTDGWKFLGTSLGIGAADLDSIQSATPQSLDDCLREMLLYWLRQIYDVERFGEPTWRRLVEAVKDKVGGNNPALAQKIARDHPDKKCRKFESQESTDGSDTFSLPQYIRVMVSNYQPLQTIFAIAESECHTREIKKDEQFSPTVTIVDTATQQPLDCVLLLHDEKPPEVNHRTLFCYIAVQVTVAQYRDAHGSHPYPLYHIESKPCKQSKLPLIFYFHQPGTVCLIQLSVHSIVDSEGVEYVHHSEGCTCVVQVREVMSRDPPLLRCTGPLITKKYHSIAQRFEEWSSSSSYEQIKNLAKHIVDDRSMKLDYKCFALCWEASTELFTSRNYEDAEYLLKTALEKVSQPECENSSLLEGMVHRVFATMFYNTEKYVTALEHISAAKDKLFLTVSPKEKVLALYREAAVKLQLFRKQMDSSAEKVHEYKSIESYYDTILDHAKFMEHYEKQYFLFLLTEKAKYHLRTLLISDDLPPKEYYPTPHDLWMAKECLDGLALDMFQRDRFAANYCCARCDLCLWKKEYPEAIVHACQAKKFYAREKNETVATRRPNERLQLLKKLNAQCI